MALFSCQGKDNGMDRTTLVWRSTGGLMQERKSTTLHMSLVASGANIARDGSTSSLQVVAAP